jgi:hypothetical protein
MTRIQIDLTNLTAKAAREAGLLESQAPESLLSIADRAAAAGIEPMSMDEIKAEIKADRAERRRCRSPETLELAGKMGRGGLS